MAVVTPSRFKLKGVPPIGFTAALRNWKQPGAAPRISPSPQRSAP